MRDRKSTEWAKLLRFVQFKMNRQYHEGIQRSRYMAMFGSEAPLGLTTSHLPPEIIVTLETEDDLLQLEEEHRLVRKQSWKFTTDTVNPPISPLIGVFTV